MSACNIKILGTGCSSCHTLFNNAQQAVANMGLDAQVESITDMAKIMSYGVMRLPAMVVNEKVVSVGKLLSAQDVESLLKKLNA